MSETTKYTPGPWIADGSKIRAQRQVVNDDRMTVVVDLMPGRGTSVSDVFENARLISAAPEMADALTKMVSDDAFADLCEGIGEEPEWLKLARAALQKAGLL